MLLVPAILVGGGAEKVRLEGSLANLSQQESPPPFSKKGGGGSAFWEKAPKVVLWPTHTHTHTHAQCVCSFTHMDTQEKGETAASDKPLCCLHFYKTNLVFTAPRCHRDKYGTLSQDSISTVWGVLTYRQQNSD